MTCGVQECDAAPCPLKSIIKCPFRQLALTLASLWRTTRSVLITWSRHQTKHAQKAEPGGVTDEHIGDWIKTHDWIRGAKLHRNEARSCRMHGMQHKHRAAVHYQGAAANVCMYCLLLQAFLVSIVLVIYRFRDIHGHNKLKVCWFFFMFKYGGKWPKSRMWRLSTVCQCEAGNTSFLIRRRGAEGY